MSKKGENREGGVNIYGSANIHGPVTGRDSHGEPPRSVQALDATTQVGAPAVIKALKQRIGNEMAKTVATTLAEKKLWEIATFEPSEMVALFTAQQIAITPDEAEAIIGTINAIASGTNAAAEKTPLSWLKSAIEKEFDPQTAGLILAKAGTMSISNFFLLGKRGIAARLEINEDRARAIREAIFDLLTRE